VVLVHQISDVDDRVIEQLLKYIKTGSLPDNATGEVRVEENIVNYSYYCLHLCADESTDRRYSLKKSQVRATEDEIRREAKTRDI
jgi:hypothetical protein